MKRLKQRGLKSNEERVVAKKEAEAILHCAVDFVFPFFSGPFLASGQRTDFKNPQEEMPTPKCDWKGWRDVTQQMALGGGFSSWISHRIVSHRKPGIQRFLPDIFWLQVTEKHLKLTWSRRHFVVSCNGRRPQRYLVIHSLLIHREICLLLGSFLSFPFLWMSDWKGI